MTTIVYNGGPGDNTYEAQNVFPFDETFVMYGNGGNDTLRGAFLHDNIIYGGVGSDRLTGGASSNTVYGEDGNDVIECRIAGDYSELFGGAGNDSIEGGSGGGILDGGLGTDLLKGGSGGDIYVVDTTGDTIVELYRPSDASDLNPVDTVRSTVSWTLGSYLENLVLLGGLAINGTGNALGNRITGNLAANFLSGGQGNDVLSSGGGNDTLNGGVGNDRLIGGAGNDRFFVDATGDVVIETAGSGTADQVDASITYTLGAEVENLRLTGSLAINGTGNSLANRLLGNGAINALSGAAGNDTLNGGAGSDTLVGGSGRDILTGGAGNDTFQFYGVGQGGDLVLDFRNVVGDNDRFHIAAVGFGGGLVAGTTLSATQFQTRTDNLAQDNNDRFIFRTTDQTLWFDSNGNTAGGLTLIADLQAGASVTAGDIFII